MPMRPPVHRPPGMRTDIERKRAYDNHRESSHKRGYGKRWQAARKGWIAKNPLCVMCLTEGRTTAAAEVDHIIPHRGDMKLFWDRKNWQSLCKTHHSRKTATEDSTFARPRGAT